MKCLICNETEVKVGLDGSTPDCWKCLAVAGLVEEDESLEENEATLPYRDPSRSFDRFESLYGDSDVDEYVNARE